jgi:DNA (cytosine-5)-methyltransferase 1
MTKDIDLELEEVNGRLFLHPAYRRAKIELSVEPCNSFPLFENRPIEAIDRFEKAELQGAAVTTTKSRAVKTLRVVDVFCGAGGFSLGLKHAASYLGFKVQHLAAVDLDPNQIAIFNANFKTQWARACGVTRLVDSRIRTAGGKSAFSYKPEIMDPVLKESAIDIDVLIAGPPCQGHSAFNNRTRGNDPRNNLYLDAVAFAVACDAKVVVIENVQRVERDFKGVVNTAHSLLESSGYRVGFRGILSGLNYGVPQTRNRHFLVASRMGEIDISTTSSLFVREERSVAWAIGDIENGPSENDPIMDGVPELTEENLKRIDFLIENGLFELPDEKRPNCHKDGHTYPSVYGRLRWQSPAQTITQGFVSPGRGRFIHPSQRRTITAREAARLQTFPDSYNFLTRESSQTRAVLTKAIGEAVPPWLGRVPIAAGLATLV